MISTRRFLAIALCLIGGAAQAEVESDAAALCLRAAKNQAIFQMPPMGAVSRGGTEPGAVTCTWTFDGNAYGPGTLIVELATHLMQSEAAARTAIVIARLPENHRGKTLEALPKMGDGGNMLTVVEDRVVKVLEIEAIMGRRHFLMTVRSTGAYGLPDRVQWHAINFLGVGVHQF
ncbi:MAG: hypothetical protein WCP68_05395 [Enhydrobacter sp.]